MEGCLIGGVEKGVVISGFQKDYELQSWNEQGEIISIEGMLTVSFCHISPCFHIDRRKRLYLIIKIHYLVNMSLVDKILNKEMTDDEKIELLTDVVNGYDGVEFRHLKPHLDEILEEYKELKNQTKMLESTIQKSDLKETDFGLGKGLLPINFEKYAEWVIEVPKLKQRIKELEERLNELKPEIKTIKKENLRLKIVSGETQSGWKKDQDMIERDNPETGKLEQYKCPIDFEHHRVRDLKYLDDKRLMVNFYHSGAKNYDCNFYKMPTDAYLWLCGELPEQKDETTKLNKIKIDSKEQMVKHLDSCGIKYYGLDYFDVAIDFILNNKGKKFETKDFRREAGIQSPTTTQNYLKMFADGKIILKIKTGLWKVIIQ